jgi:hypothetical protein
MLAYYARRENMHFAVVNRAWTTSKIHARLSIITTFVLRINVIVLITVVLTSPSHMRERAIRCTKSVLGLWLRLLHMMNVRFSLLNMVHRILGVTLPNF